MDALAASRWSQVTNALIRKRESGMRVKEVNADRWDDVAQVMGTNGASAGCWCMFWRLTNQQIQAHTADDNRAALQAIVSSEEHAGLLLYDDDEPIGWCSAAPRPDFPRLFHTKGITVDGPEDSSVWSVVCIFVRRECRRQGVAGKLLDAAVIYAREHGAAVVEGYPLADAEQGRRSGLSSGTIEMFTRAGFTRHEASGQTLSGRRVVMRRMV
jgi:GNAT superfamily N-acetyltransferase